MPEVSSADFELFQEFKRSRPTPPAPAPAPAAPEVMTIDQCLQTFHDCVVSKDQAMAPAPSTFMALAPAPAPSTFMALAPAPAPASGPATQPEVFGVAGSASDAYTISRANADKTCQTLGATLATSAQLASAQTSGADWCMTGWLSDTQTASYPSTTRLMTGCGNGTAGVKNYTPPGNLAAVNCYGKKPADGVNPLVKPFSESKWSQFSESGTKSVLSSGQAIQVDPVKISTVNPPTPTNQPTGRVAGAVVSSFTISLDITTSGKSVNWFRVYGSDPHPGFPGIWIAPTSLPSAVIRVHVGSYALDIPATTLVPFNSYFNLVVVYDNVAGTCTLYLNGTQVATGTVAPVIWPSTLSTVNFNNGSSTDISTSVKNVYWFNKALTPAEIKTIAAPPGTGTSGYAHEGSPFGGLVGRRNWRLILILFLLVIMLWIVAKKM